MSGHLFVLLREAGEPVIVGTYDSGPIRPGDVGMAHLTRDRKTAERWRRDLTAGRLPESRAQESSDREWGQAASSAAAAGPDTC